MAEYGREVSSYSYRRQSPTGTLRWFLCGVVEPDPSKFSDRVPLVARPKHCCRRLVRRDGDAAGEGLMAS